MALAKVFKNRVANCKVFTPEGRQITFVNHKHITTIEKDIKYLTELVEEGDAYVYIDQNEVEVDTEDLSPEGQIRKLKREAVEEYLAQQARAAQHESTSVQGQLNPGTTKTISPVMMESSSTSEAASIAPATPATPAATKSEGVESLSTCCASKI